jgi:hypothetical protein
MVKWIEYLWWHFEEYIPIEIYPQIHEDRHTVYIQETNKFSYVENIMIYTLGDYCIMLHSKNILLRKNNLQMLILEMFFLT